MTAKADRGPQSNDPERKKIKLEDIGYMMVEDDEFIRSVHERRFKCMDVKNLLGSVDSVDEALRVIRSLIDDEKELDLVVLDKNFLIKNGDMKPNADAAYVFLTEFEKLKAGLQGEQRVRAEKINIVLHSSSLRKDDIERMQAISKSMIGAIDKNDGDLQTRIAGVLAREGIVEDDGTNEYIVQGKALLENRNEQ